MKPSPRELLFKDDELRKWLASITATDRFRLALCFVRASLLSKPGITPEQQEGMLAYERELLSIADPSTVPAPMMSPGLNHTGLDDLSAKRARPTEEKK